MTEDPSDNQASKIRILTNGGPHALGATQFNLDIYDGHRYPDLFSINLQDPLTTLINPYTELQLSTRVVSELHYHLIQKWLDICTDGAQHLACNDSGDFRRPTRLRDLNYYYNTDDNSSRHGVRLVEENLVLGSMHR
jgi:hypothetical protein